MNTPKDYADYQRILAESYSGIAVALREYLRWRYGSALQVMAVRQRASRAFGDALDMEPERAVRATLSHDLERYPLLSTPELYTLAHDYDAMAASPPGEAILEAAFQDRAMFLGGA